MHPCTFSKELVLSLLLSRRLFPESVETREPLESAWWTELTLGVELWGDAAGIKYKKLLVCCMSEDNFMRTFFSITTIINYVIITDNGGISHLFQRWPQTHLCGEHFLCNSQVSEESPRSWAPESPPSHSGTESNKALVSFYCKIMLKACFQPGIKH